MDDITPFIAFSYGLVENDNTKFKPYNKAEYHRALGEMFDADGVSPLAPTLREIRKDFNKREGRIAVIVISDGKDMDDREVFAAEDEAVTARNGFIAAMDLRINGAETPTLIATMGLSVVSGYI